MKRPSAAGLGLAAVLVAGLALRLRQAFAPLETLLRRSTSDDAFYYLAIARRLAAGDGASFDGETPTNGFHPL